MLRKCPNPQHGTKFAAVNQCHLSLKSFKWEGEPCEGESRERMDRLGQGPSILATPTSPLGELQESLCEWLIQSPRVTRLIADIAQDVNGSWPLLMPLSDALPAVHSLGACAQHRSRLQLASRRGPIAPFLQMRNAVFSQYSCGVAGRRHWAYRNSRSRAD